MDESMDQLIIVKTAGQTEGWKESRMVGWTDGGWAGGWMDEWVDGGWAGGWMDGWTE